MLIALGVGTFASPVWSELDAQVVRGLVTMPDRSPVASVVVELRDSASRTVAHTLSNEKGEFRLVATGAGTFGVRSIRIGYRPQLDWVTLRVGEEHSIRVVLANGLVMLDTVRVLGRNACGRLDPAASNMTFGVWEQARSALTAALLTAGGRGLTATVIGFDRVFDATGRRLLQQSSGVTTGLVTRPWRALAADSLHRIGFVTTAPDGGKTFHAPGLEVLLSDVFLADHCFHIEESAADRQVGLKFRPNRDRSRIAEIEGTLWLDRNSAELRSLVYRYVNIETGGASGRMAFAKLSNGAWVIASWSIRMPVQEPRAGAFGSSREPRVFEVWEVGGQLALARSGDDTLWAMPPVTLSGTVRDSSSGDPVEGARVRLAGTSLQARTDRMGRFALRQVLPGDYLLEVRTHSLDSVAAFHAQRIALFGADTTATIRVVSGPELVRGTCASSRSARELPNRGIILGTVTNSDGRSPAARVVVVGQWETTPTATSGSSITTERAETRTDASGAFHICGVPVEVPVRVHVEGTGQRASNVRIAEGIRFARADLVVESEAGLGAVISGTVVADSMKEPIARAEVSLPNLGRVLLTDDSGAFRFADVPLGQHRFLVRRTGFFRGDTVLNVGTPALLIIQVTLPRREPAGHADGARFASGDLVAERASGSGVVVSGTVVADSTMEPVANVELSLPGLGRATLTDDRGAFRLPNVPAGQHRFLARRVGFGPVDTVVSVGAKNLTMRRVILPRIVLLDSVSVTASRIDRFLLSFEEHQKIGLGHFFTRDDLAKVEGQSLPTILRLTPGVRIMPGTGSHAWLTSGRGQRSLGSASIGGVDSESAARGARRACYAHVYLDNSLVYGGRSGERLFNLGTISAADIEAMEYYSGPAQTPARYTRLNAVCGVLVIWTRRR